MSGLPMSASSEIEPRGEVSGDLKSALQSLVTDEAMAATPEPVGADAIAQRTPSNPRPASMSTRRTSEKAWGGLC